MTTAPSPVRFMADPRERTRFARFLVVGAIGAVVDFGVMNLLTHFFHAPLVLAGTLSFIAAVLSNFTWNRFWTYPDSRSKPIARQLGQFTLVSVTGLGIRVPILAALEPVLGKFLAGLPFALPVLVSGSGPTGNTVVFWAKNITLAIAVLIVLFWNFFANRFWTYSDV